MNEGTSKKQWVVILCICTCFIVIVFGTGYWAGRSNGRIENDTEYEARLATITSLNTELQNENKRLAELNQLITDRLKDVTDRLAKVTDRFDSAKDIIDGIGSQLDQDDDTIQRILDNLSILEKAISIIFDPA